jgi:hypothetical protein
MLRTAELDALMSGSSSEGSKPSVAASFLIDHRASTRLDMLRKSTTTATWIEQQRQIMPRPS